MPNQDAVIAVTAIFALLTAEAWVKLYRLRVQGGPLVERREALGLGIAGLVFTFIFGALTTFGLIVEGSRAYTWPVPRTWADWLALACLVLPVIVLSGNLAHAAGEAVTAVRLRRRSE